MAPLQTLTIKDVLIAGRKAINAGTLQALVQNGYDYADQPSCCNIYRIDGKEIRCVIGSALNDEVIAVLEKTEETVAGLSHLVETLELVEVSEAEIATLYYLQGLHDSAAVSLVRSGPKWNDFITEFERLEKEHGTFTEHIT